MTWSTMAERKRSHHSLARSFYLVNRQRTEITRETRGMAFPLLDTRWFETEQPEGSLLDWCWRRELGEAVSALQRHPHGVAGQRAEMFHQIGKSHDPQPLGVPLGCLLPLLHLRRFR